MMHWIKLAVFVIVIIAVYNVAKTKVTFLPA